MKKKGVSLFLSLVFLCSFFAVAPVFAQAIVGDATNNLDTVRGISGVAKTDLPTASGELVRLILLIVGGAFFGLMIYGGITWITAQGEDDKIEAARHTITAATIGLFIAVGAYAVTIFITQGLLQGVTSGAGGPAKGGIKTSEGESASLICCQLTYQREAMGRPPQTAAYMATSEQCAYDGSHPADGERVLDYKAVPVVDATQCTPRTGSPNERICCVTTIYDSADIEATPDRRAGMKTWDACFAQGAPPGKEIEYEVLPVSQPSECR